MLQPFSCLASLSIGIYDYSRPILVISHVFLKGGGGEFQLRFAQLIHRLPDNLSLTICYLRVAYVLGKH